MAFCNKALVSTIYLFATLSITVAKFQFDLPTARIYSIDSATNKLRPWNNIDRNFETVVENETGLTLVCTASHPVQWVYTGNGIPAFTSTNKYSRSNSHGETSAEYTATAVINPLKEYHTGKYQCSPSEYLDLRTFFYIYVPGPTLFTSLTNKNIIIPKNDTNILIPCTASNPKAVVTLDKSEGEVLRRVKVKSADAVSYDPKEGFRLKLDKINDPEGTYVCTARYGSLVRSEEFRVRSYFNNYFQSDSPANIKGCKKQCGENALCEVINGEEVCRCQPQFKGNPELKCSIKCESHVSCPDDMSCFVDRECRNPCIHSQVGCGVGALCKVEKHRPVCYCPPDWIGDETIQCFNSLQGSEAETSNSSTSKPLESKPMSAPVKCGSNTECPADQTCLRTSGLSLEKQCVDSCKTRRCGRNAECKTEDHRASCVCLAGFSGDARIECSPSKLQTTPSYAEPLQADQPQSEQSSRFVDSRKDCSKPEECGPDSECKMDKSGNQQCLCKEGYMGQAPKCRPECKQNKDCSDKHVCLNDDRVGYPACAKVCGSKVCGAHADCFEDEGIFECFCPEGTHGDPLAKCETKEVHLGRDCSTDYDCGIKLRCETGVDYRKCVDPCEAKNCRAEFVCNVVDHIAVCACPKGFTGNAYVGCSKDLDLSDSAMPVSCNLTCGSNSECRIVGGKPKCFCQSGFIGKPPACISECFSNSDCPQDLTCVQKRCRHRCDGCGKNAKCRVSPTLDRSAICSCNPGFTGNPPNTECAPIRSG